MVAFPLLPPLYLLYNGGMNTATKEICKAFSKGYEEVDDLIMNWGRENKSLNKDLKKIKALDTNARYPAGYGNMSAGNYLLGLVLTDPAMLEKLYKKHLPTLGEKGKQVCSYWKEHPAYWQYFSIKEVLKDDFLTIVDLLGGQESLLYSPGISSMQKKGDSRGKHYLCLMLPNGVCLQTAGIIRYNSLSVSDFLFYCDLFAPGESLNTVINTHYSEFFALDEISTLPVVMHRGSEVLYTWQPFTLESFDLALLGGEWYTKEIGNQVRYSLQEPDASMMTVPNGNLLAEDFPSMGFSLYRDTKTGAMAINTNALDSYAIIASLLERAYPTLALPKQPEVAISMALFSLLADMDLDLPWSLFKKFMNYKKEAEEEKAQSPDMAMINALLKEYMEAQNSGRIFDANAYCKKSGMDLEMAEGIIQSIQETYEKNMPTFEVSSEDRQYELSGWPVPPPKTRRLFADGLEHSLLFTYDEGPRTLDAFDALTGGIYKKAIFEEGLLGVIEDFFLDFFPDEGLALTIANCLVWMLFYKGREWVPVRSYAIEMLKLFPHPIQRAYPESEAFIQEFSSFTRKVLCGGGICTLKARPKASEVVSGTYAIKGSDAFFSLVERVNA